MLSGFYTYAHFRESDGKAFYIGKGKARRAWSEKGRSAWWGKCKKKHGLRVEVLATWNLEKDAFAHERLLIAAFREMGHPLVNMTDGGEGFAGGKHTPEQRAQMAIRAKTCFPKERPPEMRARISATLKANPPMHWLGRKHRPESIAKRSAARNYSGYQHEEGGIRLSLRGWAERLGMHRSAIEYRIKTGGSLLTSKHSQFRGQP